MEKKAVDFQVKTRSLAAGMPPNGQPGSNSPVDFQNEVKKLLDEGWDVLSSQSIGLDTGGGVGGAGNIMVFVTLVKYGYFEVVQNPPAAPTA